MRNIAVITVALVASLALAPTPVQAQVQVDPKALEPLAPAPPVDTSQPPANPAAQARPGKTKVGPRHRAKAATPSHSTQPASPGAKAAAPATPKTPPATPSRPQAVVVPPLPPPAPALPPPIVVPVRPATPPTPEPVSADAAGAATDIAGGLRVTFGAGSHSLNPATDGAVRSFVHKAPADPAATYTVIATAAGSEDDPSAARRVSLDRALAIRSLLIAEGIPSVRIYVKALGASASAATADAPPDRADITLSGPSGGGPSGGSPSGGGPSGAPETPNVGARPASGAAAPQKASP